MPRRHIVIAICLLPLLPIIFVMVVLALKWLIGDSGASEVETVKF